MIPRIGVAGVNLDGHTELVGCRFRLRGGGVQRSGGQPASLAIPSGINGDPSFNDAKYAYHRENANPLWGLSVGFSLKNLYFLGFSMIFEKLCNAFVRLGVAFRREDD